MLYTDGVHLVAKECKMKQGKAIAAYKFLSILNDFTFVVMRNTTIFIDGIRKDRRARGKFFHRGISGCTHTKKIAMHDISEEIGQDKLYDRNYVIVENLVFTLLHSFSPPYIPIHT